MGNCEPPRRERLGETPPNWLSFGCVSPTRWWHTASPPPHCACVRSLRSRPQRLSVGLLRFNLSEVVKHPSKIYNKLTNTKSSNPFIPPPSHIIHHTSNIKPSTSYLLHHTSYIIHHTSYIAHHTSSTPLPHWCIPSYSPLTSLLLNASFFQRRSVSVYPIFFKTRIAINYPEIIFFEHKWREWLDKSRWNL